MSAEEASSSRPAESAAASSTSMPADVTPARAAWSAASKEKYHIERAVKKEEDRQLDARERADAEYAATLEQVRAEAEATELQLKEARKRLHTVELEISTLRGQLPGDAKQAFTWEQDMRFAWEQEEEALVAEKRQLHKQQRLAMRTAAEDAPALMPPAQRALPPPAASAPPAWSELALAINLARRPDRLASLRALPWGLELEVVSAVDGRELSWDKLLADGVVTEAAAEEARWAEREGVPTICRRSGSFSPHLTLAAVGCALSHRAAWERVAKQGACEWGLIVEDDVASLSPAFVDRMRQVARTLPRSWQVRSA